MIIQNHMEISRMTGEFRMIRNFPYDWGILYDQEFPRMTGGFPYDHTEFPIVV